MKFFTAGLATETNTFSPFVTGFRTFETTYVRRGGAHDDPPSLFAAPLVRWRALAAERGWTVAESLCAFAQPAGVTLRRVYEAYRDEILADLRAAMPVDAVLLNLHGAMIADGYDDCEGDLLTHVRALVGPDTPVGAELDLHCHLTATMVEQADVLVTYKEYPHVDAVERAEDLFAIIAAMMDDQVRPRMALYDCGMIGVYHTSQQPMRDFVDEIAAMEGENGVLSISIAHGFPWGDVPDMGSRVLVVTDDRPAEGETLAAELGRRFYAMRHETQPAYKSIEQALEIVRAADEGPVVLADVADNAGGGAPNDSTFLLRALLDAGMDDVGLACLWDPVAAALALEAGEGASLEMRIGGKMGPTSGDPLDLRVTVTKTVPDAWQSFGQPPNLTRMGMGDAAALRAGELEIVVNSTRTQTFNQDAFTNLGIDPTAKRVLIVKSMQHFYASFAPIAAQIVYVAAPGALVPDFTAIPYRRARQDIWPMREGE